MNVKTRNIIELLLQGVCALLLFIPGMYTKLTYAVSIESVRITDEKTYSFFSRMDIDAAWPGWAVLICVVIGLVIYIVQVVSSKNRNLAFAAIIAPAELAFFLLFHLLFNEGSLGGLNGYTYFMHIWLPGFSL